MQDTCEINEECAPVLARSDVLMLLGGPLRLGFYVVFVNTNVTIYQSSVHYSLALTLLYPGFMNY